jgi:hypothetical protein
MLACPALCVLVDVLSLMLVPYMMLRVMHDVMTMMDDVVPVMNWFSACTGCKYRRGDGEGYSKAESCVERRFHILGFPLVGNRRGGTATRRCRIGPPAVYPMRMFRRYFPLVVFRF